MNSNRKNPLSDQEHNKIHLFNNYQAKTFVSWYRTIFENTQASL